MAPEILIVNGPNLNLLGKRQPEIYGHETLADLERACQAAAQELGLTVRCVQSNAEHQIIDWIHGARETAAGIIINAGAFSHTSVAILDALNAFEPPIIEVHLSNIHRRETFRHHSHVSAAADGVIVGCGMQGYRFALERMASLIGPVT